MDIIIKHPIGILDKYQQRLITKSPKIISDLIRTVFNQVIPFLILLIIIFFQFTMIKELFGVAIGIGIVIVIYAIKDTINHYNNLVRLKENMSHKADELTYKILNNQNNRQVHEDSNHLMLYQTNQTLYDTMKDENFGKYKINTVVYVGLMSIFVSTVVYSVYERSSFTDEDAEVIAFGSVLILRFTMGLLSELPNLYANMDKYYQINSLLKEVTNTHGKFRKHRFY